MLVGCGKLAESGARAGGVGGTELRLCWTGGSMSDLDGMRRTERHAFNAYSGWYHGGFNPTMYFLEVPNSLPTVHYMTWASEGRVA
ncbi:hypothetical protein E2C01_051656 [Portunus trituberculatus]|uniref:Uncharacterized protein n=1 Tax=Portunus trituberculatus TaxID=210409 RepID=A0A5B7GFE3_PORTR|nr:hypothetical protein [Portunus trituberculatus]